MEKMFCGNRRSVRGLMLLTVLALALLLAVFAAAPAYAEGAEPAGLAIGIAAAGGAIAMGMATARASESISRQPEAEGKIRSTMMLGLVFIETAIIYALLVVILIIFVL